LISESRSETFSRDARLYVMRLSFVMVLALSGCAAASAQSACHRDADCSLVDQCGCSCRAILGPRVPPVACSEACPGHPCVGHRAVCVSAACVMR
jgi:hypothetical protein